MFIWFEPSAESLSNNLVVEVIMRKSTTWLKTAKEKSFLYCVHIKRLHIVLRMSSIWWKALFSPWLLHECAAFNIVVLQKHSWETVCECHYCFSQIGQLCRENPLMIIFSMNYKCKHIRCEIIRINSPLPGLIYEHELRKSRNICLGGFIE